MFPKFLSALIRWSGSCVLSGGILWHVAENAGPADGEVIIHVSLPSAVVRVDGLVHEPDPEPGSPIVIRLPAGRHSLTTHRGRALIQEEAFELDRGGHVVLTAQDLSNPPPIPDRPRVLSRRDP